LTPHITHDVPLSEQFVRPPRSDNSRDPLPTALNEGTAAKVEEIGTEASRAYSTAKNDDTTIDQTDNNEGETPNRTQILG
jgi:hypothetical protein